MTQNLKSIAIGMTLAVSQLGCSHANANDPYLWMEEVRGEKPLKWVEDHNKKTLALLESDPRFQDTKSKIQVIAYAQDRVPDPTFMGEYVYNYWQDKSNPKGIWRRTSWASYQKDEIKWETVVDMDQLSRDEKTDWVWGGSSCLPLRYDRCLISLSIGGGDKKVVREFDTVTKTFMKDGFYLSEAKSNVAWLDRNTLFVATDFGPGSLTASGYPRIVKVWTRGTALKDAHVLYEGKPTDLSISGYAIVRPEATHLVLNRAVDFYTEENWIVSMNRAGTFELQKVPFPDSSEFQGLFNGRQIAKLRDPWQVGKKLFPAGSVISLKLGDSTAATELVYAAGPGVSVAGLALGKEKILLSLLDNVKGKLVWVDHHPGKGTATGKWKQKALKYPENGVVNITSYDIFTNKLMIAFQNYLTPGTLYFQEEGKTFKDSTKIKQAPERFDASGIEVSQLWATSKDGTRIPYFLLKKKDAPRGNTTPTLLYGYGGFEIPQLPFYSGSWGKVWLEEGGALAFANIRGGGEFGPPWHQAAILTQKQKSYDDFIAVAESLTHPTTGITSPKKLGIMGGSNGGLLVGATFVERPDLFRAVVCQVPLLDMMRYHLLLAGDSWKAEYGNPEDPEMAKVILKYSPYQNLQAGKAYPPVFFVTSTADDRVHPGHARKMAAKMEELGYSFEYFENTRGGHAAGADLDDYIRRTALEFTFLKRELFGPPTETKP